MKRAEERREKLSRMRLYVITGDRGDELETAKIVEAALDGGATIIQLRKKSMAMVEQYRLAMALRTLTWAHEALLIINDHADLAIAADADEGRQGSGSNSPGFACCRNRLSAARGGRWDRPRQRRRRR